ncbi:MAG: helix-turn-helix domain-containing protein [Desulfomonilaceae bacterium]
MESFGSYLKGLREEKGKTLEDISASTKIALTNLDFLEKDRYDLLPPIVFVKGFVRSYAKELGLDAEDTIKTLENFFGTRQPQSHNDDKPLIPVEEGAHGLSFVQNIWFTRILTGAGFLALLILILTGVSRVFLKDDRKPQNSSNRSGFSLSAQSSRTDKSQTSLTTVQPSSTGKKVLEIKAIANAWVRVEPDSGPAEEIIMSPGDIQVFTAKSSFRVITGNAGGIRLRFDGRVMPVLGKPNQTLALTLP